MVMPIEPALRFILGILLKFQRLSWFYVQKIKCAQARICPSLCPNLCPNQRFLSAREAGNQGKLGLPIWGYTSRIRRESDRVGVRIRRDGGNGMEAGS